MIEVKVSHIYPFYVINWYRNCTILPQMVNAALDNHTFVSLEGGYLWLVWWLSSKWGKAFRKAFSAFSWYNIYITNFYTLWRLDYTSRVFWSIFRMWIVFLSDRPSPKGAWRTCVVVETPVFDKKLAPAMNPTPAKRQVRRLICIEKLIIYDFDKI